MNLAERLGYGPQDRVLIIHADDVGVSHAATQAAFEGMASGSMTCGSILVPCPWFPEVAQHCREHPEADFGVHLTLTCEDPLYRWRGLTGREAAPGLYDEQGYLWLTTADAEATSRRRRRSASCGRRSRLPWPPGSTSLTSTPTWGRCCTQVPGHLRLPGTGIPAAPLPCSP